MYESARRQKVKANHDAQMEQIAKKHEYEQTISVGKNGPKLVGA